MSYQTILGRLRRKTKDKVMAAWVMYGKGQIDRSRFEQLTAAILGQSGAQAAAAADLAVSAELTRLTGRIANVAGVDASKRRHTYLDSIRTVLDGKVGDIEMKLQRLSLNAPLDAAQDAYSAALSKSSAEGWVRQMDADPCQLCRWWWREGRVWPKDHYMPHHSGCECVPRPVIVAKPPRPVQY